MAKKPAQILSPTFEAKTMVISAPTAELLPQTVHKALADLSSDGQTVIGVNMVQSHHHDDEDHKAVVTYCMPPK